MMARTDDDTPAAALAALPAQIDRIGARIAELERRVTLVERREAADLGAECGVALDSLRETALSLDRVRPVADVLSAAVSLGYAQRRADEQAQAQSPRLSLVPGGF